MFLGSGPASWALAREDASLLFQSIRAFFWDQNGGRAGDGSCTGQLRNERCSTRLDRAAYENLSDKERLPWTRDGRTPRRLGRRGVFPRHPTTHPIGSGSQGGCLESRRSQRSQWDQPDPIGIPSLFSDSQDRKLWSPGFRARVGSTGRDRLK